MFFFAEFRVLQSKASGCKGQEREASSSKTCFKSHSKENWWTDLKIRVLTIIHPKCGCLLSQACKLALHSAANTSLIRKYKGWRNVTQLRSFLENLGSIPGTHVATHKHLYLQFQGPTFLLSLGSRHTHAAQTDRHADKTPIYTQKKKILKSKKQMQGPGEMVSEGTCSHKAHTLNTQEAETEMGHQCEFKTSLFYTLSSRQDYIGRNCWKFFSFLFLFFRSSKNCDCHGRGKTLLKGFTVSFPLAIWQWHTRNFKFYRNLKLEKAEAQAPSETSHGGDSSQEPWPWCISDHTLTNNAGLLPLV